MKKIPEWKERFIREHQDMTHKKLAEHLGIGTTTVNRVKSDMNKTTEGTNAELGQELQQDNYLQDIDKKNAKNELQSLKKKYGEVLKEIELSQGADGLWKELQGKSSDVKIEKVHNNGKNESTAVLMASDWHIEETVDKNTINGLNEYNPAIAKERAELFWNNSLNLINMMKDEEKISNVVIGLLGDFITGYIHPELIEGNSMSPTESILYVKQLITSGIDMILENSELDLTIVTAFGNHGRTTDKKRISTGWKNSYEWMMYNLIAQQYMNNDRVKMKVEKGYHNYIQVYDKMLRMHHGDGMKYQGGVGGITIPVNKAIAQRNKAKQADYDLFGHRHTLMDGGNFVSNGSLIGYGPYAESIKASFEEPKQAMFLLNSEFGKTISAPIFVTDHK